MWGPCTHEFLASQSKRIMEVCTHACHALSHQPSVQRPRRRVSCGAAAGTRGGSCQRLNPRRAGPGASQRALPQTELQGAPPTLRGLHRHLPPTLRGPARLHVNRESEVEQEPTSHYVSLEKERATPARAILDESPPHTLCPKGGKGGPSPPCTVRLDFTKAPRRRRTSTVPTRRCIWRTCGSAPTPPSGGGPTPGCPPSREALEAAGEPRRS